MPQAVEVATIVVDGEEFTDWETMKITRVVGQAFSTHFEFSSSDPRVSGNYSQESYINFKNLAYKVRTRLRVGQRCQIFLGGQLACTGMIENRQITYDKQIHAIQVSGRAVTGDVVDSSPPLKTGQFKDYPWSAIAQNILAPFGIGLSLKNMPGDASRPFENVQTYPGETCMQFLDRLARQRGILITDDEKGNLVAGTHDAGAKATHELQEGRNILRVNITESSLYSWNENTVIGQATGNDKRNMGASSDVAATAVNGFVNRYRPLVMNMEEPGTRADAQSRANNEVRHQMMTQVQMTVEVQGWFKYPKIELWKVMENVTVWSPLAFPESDEMTLGVQQVIFSQSNGGTFTTLTLVRPEALSDISGIPNLGRVPNAATPGNVSFNQFQTPVNLAQIISEA